MGVVAAAPLSSGLQAPRTVAASTIVSANPGSQFQSDPAHTGVQSASGIAPPLRVRWGANIPSHPSYAIVGSGHVFVTYNLLTQEALLALNESDGSTFFGPVALGPETSGHYAGLSYDAGRVFTSNASCLVDAVDAGTGTIAWQTQLPDSDCFGPLTASNGTVFVPRIGSVTALSELDGHQLWMNTSAGADNSAPAVTAGGVYVGQAAQFNDVSPTNGNTIWHFNGPTTGGGGRTTPVAGGRVYARRSDANTGYVLDAGTGAQLATFTSLNVPAIDSTLAYYETDLTTGVNRVTCGITCGIEAHRVSDQGLQWASDGDGQLDTPPLELDGTVYVGSNTGTIFGLAATSGQPVWSGATAASTVSPSGGGADIWPYDEQNASSPPSALGAGDGMLFVTYGQVLTAYEHAAPGTVPAFEYHSTGDNGASCDGHGTRIDHGCAWPFKQTANGNDHALVDLEGGSQPTAVSIVNASGQTVASATGNGGTIALWASAVPVGSYTLQVRTTDPSIHLNTLISAYYEIDTPASPPASPAAFTAQSPHRLLDTRLTSQTLGSQMSLNLTVAGGTSGVPTGASAVILNVTVTRTTESGVLTVWPAGQTRPMASNLNWGRGETRANLVNARVGAGGQVTIYNAAGRTDVVVDVEGYFAAPIGTAGGYNGLAPARLLDTRITRPSMGGGSTLALQIFGQGGVPASGVSAVVLNVTATDTTTAGFLTVYPSQTTQPAASTLNWNPGRTVSNRAIVKVGPDGKVNLFNAQGNVDVVVDVSGYFTDVTASGKLFTATNPARMLDTRVGGGAIGPNRSLANQQIAGIDGIPSDTTAVFLNVTVTDTTAAGFLTVYPNARPATSDLNWVKGQTVPNLAVATLSSGGTLNFYNATGSTDLVVDIAGWFS